MLRLLHTADWHLGHTLHDLPRDGEHDAFLAWLLDQVAEHGVHALLIAGDVFETANPPARAMRAWYGFLARARVRFPTLDIVIIGGNHDSPARLEAAHPILDELRIHVIGALARSADGELALDRLVVPLHGADGQIAAWCLPVPFLRPADLPAVDPGIQDGGDPLVAGVRAVYERVIDLARARRGPGQALVAMGHCYMVGGQVSDLSERRVLGGNQHALPAGLFPADLAYVALGHLHRAQAVGGREGVRYSGSPIPLAVDEAGYPHQVRLVELDGPRLVTSRSLPVPRTVDVLRLPPGGPAPWDQVQPLLAALPAAPASPSVEEDRQRWPFLEVRVALDGPMPTLRRQVEQALADRAVRLVKLQVDRAGDGRSLAEVSAGRDLGELGPDQVFRRKWAREHGGDPPAPVLACLHELLDAVRQQDGTTAPPPSPAGVR